MGYLSIYPLNASIIHHSLYSGVNMKSKSVKIPVILSVTIIVIFSCSIIFVFLHKPKRIVSYICFSPYNGYQAVILYSDRKVITGNPVNYYDIVAEKRQLKDFELLSAKTDWISQEEYDYLVDLVSSVYADPNESSFDKYRIASDNDIRRIDIKNETYFIGFGTPTNEQKNLEAEMSKLLNG